MTIFKISPNDINDLLKGASLVVVGRLQGQTQTNIRMANEEKGPEVVDVSENYGVDLDEILVNEVGPFGRYQIIMLLLASIPIIFSAWASGEYIFTTARIPTRSLYIFINNLR